MWPMIPSEIIKFSFFLHPFFWYIHMLITSLCLSLSVSLCLSLSLSVSVHLYLSLSISVCLCLCPSLSLSVSVSVRLCSSLSLFVSVCLCPSLSIMWRRKWLLWGFHGNHYHGNICIIGLCWKNCVTVLIGAASKNRMNWIIIRWWERGFSLFYLLTYSFTSSSYWSLVCMLVAVSVVNL